MPQRIYPRYIFHFLSQRPHLIYGQIQFFRHLNQCYGRNNNNQRQQIALNFRQISIIDGINNFFGEFFGFSGIFFVLCGSLMASCEI